jgi:prepilin-type N-terminal cleavage/methylation domain-containing protein
MKKNGFSLTELIIAMAITAVLIAAAVSGFGWLTQKKLRGSAIELLQKIMKAELAVRDATGAFCGVTDITSNCLTTNNQDIADPRFTLTVTTVPESAFRAFTATLKVNSSYAKDEECNSYVLDVQGSTSTYKAFSAAGVDRSSHCIGRGA